MEKFGAYQIKKIGKEAFEAECRKHADWAVKKDAETKQKWDEYQKKAQQEAVIETD